MGTGPTSLLILVVNTLLHCSREANIYLPLKNVYHCWSLIDKFCYNLMLCPDNTAEKVFACSIRSCGWDATLTSWVPDSSAVLLFRNKAAVTWPDQILPPSQNINICWLLLIMFDYSSCSKYYLFCYDIFYHHIYLKYMLIVFIFFSIFLNKMNGQIWSAEVNK